MVITGASTHKVNFGILIAGDGQIYNGVLFEGSIGPIANDILSYSSAVNFLDDLGSHANGISLGGAYSNTPLWLNSNTALVSGGATNNCLFMSSTAVGLCWGSGAPTFAAAEGSLYLSTNGSTYHNTTGASGGWSAI
jgi:hypothetical protein